MNSNREKRTKRSLKDDDAELIPPEGGWGWVVVAAFAVANMFVFGTMSTFTLIFKDRFVEVGLTATDITLIISMNAGIGIGFGFAIGPLINVFGYRVMSFIGGAFISVGLIVNSWAYSFEQFLLAYSILTAIGMEICLPTFALAVNTYFREKRTKAFGVGLTLGGMGFIFYPQMVRYFLEEYGITGCSLLVGAVSFHILVAAALLQPVKYHAKRKRVANPKLKIDDSLRLVTQEIAEVAANQCSSVVQSKEGDNFIQSRTSDESQQIPCGSKDDHSTSGTKHRHISGGSSSGSSESSDHGSLESGSNYKKPPSNWVELFGLDLLKDVRFVTLVVGFCLCIFAETNFSLLTPLMLAEMTYTNREIANFLSLLGTTDIISRFIGPYVAGFLGWSVQCIASLSLVCIIIGRIFFIYVQNYNQLLLVGIALGLAKGFRCVFTNLVIPAYLPLDRLAAGAGIQTVLKGVLMVALGPLLGLLKDYTGSYLDCVVVINIAMGVTVAMWTIDLIYIKCTKGRYSDYIRITT